MKMRVSVNKTEKIATRTKEMRATCSKWWSTQALVETTECIRQWMTILKKHNADYC